MPLFRSTFLLVFLSMVFSVTALRAQKETPAPTDYLVNDYAGLLNRNEVVALGNKLRDYFGETSTQIVIVTEKSLEGDDAFSYVQRLAEKWGVGGKENSNGILIYVAEQDRQMRIQTGYGTEGFLPDVTAKRIIEGIMVPAFRTGDYYQGLDRATDAIMDLGRGEYEGNGLPSGEGIPDWAIILLFLALMIFLSWLNQNDDDDDGGYYRGGRYDMPDRRYRRRRGGTIIFPGGFGNGGGGGGNSGGGFGGFGGGGFGGFGGGGFGGGGAGGSW